VIEMTTREWLPRQGLDRLIALLQEDGRRVIGPTVRDSAIVYGEIASGADLPNGIHDEQAPGRYRISTSAGDDPTAKAFDYASSPSSWKSWTFPPTVPMARATREGDRLTYDDVRHDAPRLAFLGVRACDLAALAIHDEVLAGGPYIDEDYADRRGKAFIVAVECGVPSSTCFCVSMGTGPEVRSGFDIALTELPDGYVLRAGSEAGRKVADRLGLAEAGSLQTYAAAGVTVAARAVMAEQLGVTTEGLKDRLMAQLESEGWDEIAEACLACTSCTMVCPTCFCSDVKLTTDLLGTTSQSERRWASCFTLDFARVAHGNFRPRVRDRYRQWLTHKFSTWVDQFGSFGCVGCGRCITWCPVGIDVRKSLLRVAPLRPALQRSEKPVPVSANPGHYSLGTIAESWPETKNVYTLRLTDLPESVCNGLPGQFLMLDLPGFSAVPISISRYRDGEIFLTIRTEGASTYAITSLPPGSQVGLRGPVGQGWPVEEAFGRDVVIVAGGIGLPPLRPLIDRILANRGHFGSVRLFYGARTPADLVYTEELKGWAARDDIVVGVTVDRAKVGTWSGAVGVVTHLFDREPIDGSHTTAYVCGPEKMMSATSNSLAGRGILPERIFLSMERHMECGIGLCGHCQMGRYFVCKDGPVFSRRDLGESLDLEGM
jgi:NAD(P)H-flavin reductase/formate hydrogenlyase subunit 6/NADH:ubiquinone oxidoreductase subunit I